MRISNTLLNSMFALSFPIVLGGCNSAADTTSEQKSEYTREYFKEKEDVKSFFDAYKDETHDTVASVLWKPRDKYTKKGVTCVWYTLDDPPFITFEASDNLRLGGFTLRFINDKLTKYDLDFR